MKKAMLWKWDWWKYGKKHEMENKIFKKDTIPNAPQTLEWQPNYI